MMPIDHIDKFVNHCYIAQLNESKTYIKIYFIDIYLYCEGHPAIATTESVDKIDNRM